MLDPSNPSTWRDTVFTGVSKHGTRHEVQSGIRRLGASASPRITARTNLLITGDKPGAAKLAEAKRRNITVMDEAVLEAALPAWAAAVRDSVAPGR